MSDLLSEGDWPCVHLSFEFTESTTLSKKVLKPFFPEHLLYTKCSTRIFTGIITPQALSSRFTDTPSEALSYATRSKSHRGEGTAKIPEDGNRELPHSWLRIMSLGPKNLQSDLKNLPIFPIPGASNSACPILTRSLGRGDNRGCRRPAASSRHTPWEGNTCVDLDF